MIKIQGLNKFFNKGKQNQIHVINDVSLELPTSGMVAIFGKSGCGKTTLLNVIGGLDGYESGSLTIEGNDIGKDTDVIRNKYIGYIFQNYNLNKSQTCFENIASALRLCGINDAEILQKRVNAALSNVDMINYAGRTPDTLSGGQQQRIAIARAIVKNPSIILADEPTGNLDEANTVMIMDLLKQISRDRLVLLVTHEANLVDYYCDTVIELSDGKVVDIRNNQTAEGYAARGKNDIYLGELERSEIADGNARIEFYGDAPETPINLKIVNNGGKLYVRIDTPKVQVLDQSSEVKLREGVYTQSEEQTRSEKKVDMSDLPPIEGSRFGKLFSFKSAIKSGYDEGFKKARMGKKVLRGCMCMFAAVMVLMSAVFGTSFNDIINVSNSYNHNVFYVYTPNAETSEKLVAAANGKENGVDYVRLMYGTPAGDSSVKFMMGFFESFSFEGYDEGFRTNAVYLDVTLAEGLRTVAGKSEDLSFEDVLITTKVADALLDKSSLGYISEYDDLIGLTNSTMTVNGKSLRVAGVVDSNETAVYMTEMAMATHIMSSTGLNVKLDTESGYDVESGTTALAIRHSDNDSSNIPTVGDTVQIHGVSLTVDKIIKYSSSYDEWLKNNGVEKMNEDEYFRKRVEEKYPDSYDMDFHVKYEELRQAEYYDYIAYYNDHIDEYLTERYLFDGANDRNLWMYVKKNVEEVKYMYMSYGGSELYAAEKYKEANGVYPVLGTVKDVDTVYKIVEQKSTQYNDEFNMNVFNGNQISSVYFVDEKDYIAFTKQIGETHDMAATGEVSVSQGKDIVYIESSSGVVSSSSSSSSGSSVYTVIHSTDPDATAAWLYGEFSDITAPNEYSPAILAPDDIFDEKIKDHSTDIITGLITMAVVIVVLSVCMYFIMRSSLLNRIKEVGIYRAIGVSKRNLTFKFFIEALLITTLTVLIGYILTSAFIFACLGMSAMMETVFFYPVWLAAAVLGILYFICMFFGTLPILSLLRKTPSEILAKYDI